MGEAKRRRESAAPTVYHHTSTLRTNLIWMAGVIEVEGKSQGAFHPKLGEIKTDAITRRAMNDFPALAWFTTNIDIPKTLTTGAAMFTVDKTTGERKELKATSDDLNALALNRVALGFHVSDIPVAPWREHKGYSTEEGQELNESARSVGDDPRDWYVSETPVDVLQASEFWMSPSVINPKLRRLDAYIPEMRRMVTMCRETKGCFIPPSWLKPEEAMLLAKQLGKPVRQFS
ncbi:MULTISPECIES: hypothetical protein [unclassified Mesorhizobium]|uniref:hypothetical protein n=1 Tax=unclassified Mesorhizobium TaxID=325217 RepID=UPI000F763455|nr:MULTISPECIES: hypothetical protein [unclassified Mesorhizobium]AZO54845.1 hypothetical protein EJ077_16365 [Mesorhizobium sp. M8A.F.Ca.ET.057.01.1.1]RWE44172.1 MAG: hypothetical protein EOS80_19695 [Mesorhizobium sp.]